MRCGANLGRYHEPNAHPRRPCFQKLAKRLGLPSKGKRDDIVDRLTSWHREQRSEGQVGQFHAVQVRATPEGKAISPRLLTPLQPPTPKGGILSAKRQSSFKDQGSTPKPLEQRGGVLFSPVRVDTCAEPPAACVEPSRPAGPWVAISPTPLWLL